MRFVWVLVVVACTGDDDGFDAGTVDSSSMDAANDAPVSDSATDSTSTSDTNVDAMTDASAVDSADDVGTDAPLSEVGELCRRVSDEWRPGGTKTDESSECLETAEYVATVCPRLPDFCLEYWMCLDERSDCRTGIPDRAPACTAVVPNPMSTAGGTYECLLGESSEPPPIAGPGDEACRGASDVVEALEVSCFGAGGGFSDSFCAATRDDCEGYWNCLAGSAECDTDLRMVVWGEECDSLNPDGFDCRRGR